MLIVGMTAFLNTEQRGRLLIITLNRGDRKNALNQEMCEAMVAACEAADADVNIGAIWWRAEGPVFSVGMDHDEATPASTEVHARLFNLGDRLTKPIICTVQGPALAGGLGLVANAHVVVAAHGSSFGMTEVRIGIWPFTMYAAVEAALGPRRMVELALTSKIFNTPEALAWGLIHEVVPPYELEERGEALGQQLANGPTETIARGLRFSRELRGLRPKEAMQVSLVRRAEQYRSLEYEEGLKAFREKRAPRWPSHPE